MDKIELIKALLEDDAPQPTAPPSTAPYITGDYMLIRTVTMTLTGRLVGVYPQELVLTNAAWIADTGRFADAVASSEFSEVEPFPADRHVIVGRGAIIDAVEIDTLPTKQK